MLQRWQPGAQALSSLNEFNELLGLHAVLVVRAWAQWNGIDRTIEPLVEAFRSAHEPEVKLVSVDVDNVEFRDLLRDASVVNVPSFLVFRQGKHAATIQNEKPPQQLLLRLREAVIGG